MPWQILLALISLAWVGLASGGRHAGVSVGRIGEVVVARRKDLLLPQDVGDTIDFILVSIAEPKTRSTAARHQSVKIDQLRLCKWWLRVLVCWRLAKGSGHTRLRL